MRLRRLGARGMFLGVLAGVLAGYSVLSWDMAWRMPSGQIGPGFFPRLIGVAALVLCLVALWRHDPGDGADTGADTGTPTHPPLLAGAVCACVGFFVLLAVAGALVGGVVFLSGALMLLNPGRRRLVGNAALGVGLPVTLYVLFERVLDAQLPSGIF
ncbi:tripartite tricarboxylate transporter TctB family protein [Actinopolymorpha sp. B17G11]|uniref:tripartite tricarboxylate transporter TctB family protein n=1 Tax=Actinopolymorpha sp. B17G11 TaxID=3160861 RepID=UPI0032E48C2C